MPSQMATLLGQSNVRTFIESQPLFPLSEWWQTALLLALLAILSLFVFLMYRRDSVELPSGLTFLLTTLRLLALVALVVFLLNPSRRSETRLVKDSRLAVLVDTSLSMGLRDQEEQSPVGAERTGSRRRIDRVIDFVQQQESIGAWRKKHDVSVYRFGDLPQPELITVLKKSAEGSEQIVPLTATEELQESLVRSKQYGWAGLIASVIGVLVLLVWLFARIKEGRLLEPESGKPRSPAAWLLACGVLTLMVALVLFAFSDLATSKFDLWTSLGWKPLPTTASSLEANVDREESNEEKEIVEWNEALLPQGTSTKLGAAIEYVVNKERGGPIAGIIVITDGRHNSGPEPTRAIAAAANAGIPIFPVGIGSTMAPMNVQVADIQAPPRVFPSDKFQIKALIQASSLAGKTIGVQLYSVDEKETEAEILEDETAVRLLEDGQPANVTFDVSRQEQGKRRYIVRTATVEGDLDLNDNQRGATVEIVDRKTKVLLIAGGPTREFRFLRNQLYRDPEVNLHVWLQSAREGADQESDELLFEFPQTRQGLFEYDCLIGFDPDWRDLNAEQAANLERWVAEKAGGMLIVAGPVNTPEWTRRSRGDKVIDQIRKLYPVSFYNQGSSVLKLGRFGGAKAFPLEFSREGRAAQFLWIGDTAAESAATWGRFKGVFGYYAVNEPKQGADILANFADSSTSIDDRLPIYLASQYYGSGRVFFQASGEMWRVRNLEVEYFEQYYNQLIRWASQGRLLRDSTRGVLLTDRERCWMGDQVTVQAMLRTPQDEPLLTQSVEATILKPDGSSQRIALQASKDSVRPGTFTGQFTAGIEGEFRISLPVPDSPELEVLMTSLQANIPDLEKERPQRNDSLLAEIADKTRGHYYVGMNELAVDEEVMTSPSQLIVPQDQETFIPGAPDRFFQRRLMMWLLGLLVTFLCVEWTTRRLHKLA